MCPPLTVLYLEESLGLGDHVGQTLSSRQVLAQVPLVRPTQTVLPVTRPAAATQQQQQQQHVSQRWTTNTRTFNLQVLLPQQLGPRLLLPEALSVAWQHTRRFVTRVEQQQEQEETIFVCLTSTDVKSMSINSHLLRRVNTVISLN